MEPVSQAFHALPLLAEGILPPAVVTLAQPQDLVCPELHFLQLSAAFGKSRLHHLLTAMSFAAYIHMSENMGENVR